MAVNKPLLPRPPFAPGTFQGDQSRALERELQKLQLSVKQLRDGRIEGVLALDAAPTGGVWAQGDVVQNSDPTRTISASTTFVVWGWQYTDAGAGTLTWAEMRWWESMAAGGGGGTFAATSMTATTTGVGTSLYAGNPAGELTLRNLQAGSGISLTISAGAVRITNTGAAGGFAATSQTATSTGTGVDVYVGNAAGELTFRKVQAGTGISVTTSGGAIRIASTGGGGLTFGSITATNTGSGIGVYAGNSGTELTFRSLQAGTGVSLTTSGGAAVIGTKLISEWGTPLGAAESRVGFRTSTVSTAELAQRLMALITDLTAAGVLRQPLYWNAADAGTGVSLTNSNLTAHVPGTTWRGVRATKKANTGKRYYEVVYSAATNNGEDCIVGVGTESASLESYLGLDGGGYGWQGAYTTPRKINANSFPSYGATVTAGDVVGVLMDFDTATLTFYKNGVSQGAAFTSLSATLYPMISVNSDYKPLARFESTSWSYAPTGAIQWDT